MFNVIEVDRLTHYYGPRQSLDGLTFEVRQGEVFGLLGPNGAGKTTTIRLLNGLFTPTSGTIRVLGLDPARQGEQVRARTGVLTETPALYERLTARQNLMFFATLSGVPARERAERVNWLLEQFDLTARADDLAGAFSKGMKQRLALARAMLHRPELLFLDEPTAGLDPEASAQVRDWIAEVTRQEGMTVVLCTHILSEAERLCDRVAIMAPRRLLAVGSLDELAQRLLPGQRLQVELYEPCSIDFPRLRALPGVLGVETGANPAGPARELVVQIKDASIVPDVASALMQMGARLLRLQPEHVSLEDVYFKLQQSAEEVRA